MKINNPLHMMNLNHRDMFNNRLEGTMDSNLFAIIKKIKIKNSIDLVDHILYTHILPRWSKYYPFYIENIPIGPQHVVRSRNENNVASEYEGISNLNYGYGTDSAFNIGSFKNYKLPRYYMDDEQEVIRKPLGIVNFVHPMNEFSNTSYINNNVMSSHMNTVNSSLLTNRAMIKVKLKSTVEDAYLELDKTLNSHYDFRVSLGYVTDIEEINPMSMHEMFLPYAEMIFKQTFFNQNRNFSNGEVNIGGIAVDAYISDWGGLDSEIKELEKLFRNDLIKQSAVMPGIYKFYSI